LPLNQELFESVDLRMTMRHDDLAAEWRLDAETCASFD